jgi:hypothetical protein
MNPDVLMFPGPEPTVTARRVLLPATVLVVLLVLVACAYGSTMGFGATGRGPAAADGPRLIAPDAVSAGERIPVFVDADRRACGRTELRFDDDPVEHRLTRYAPTGVFMTLDVPATATRGRHEIRAGCSTSATRPAVVTVTVGP